MTISFHSLAARCDQAIFIGLCGLMALMPFSSGAVQFFIYFVLAVFLFRLIIQRNDLSFKFSAIDVAIAVWLVFCVISILVNPFQAMGWRGLLFKVLPGVGVFYAFGHIMKQESRIRWFLISALAGIFVVCLAGVSQYVFGEDFIRHRPLVDGRIFSTMKAPNSMAGFLMTFSPILLMMAWGSRGESAFKFGPASEKQSRLLILTVFILAVFCLGLTYSRGGWLSFAIVMTGLALVEKRLRLPVFLILLAFFFYFSHKIVGERKYMDTVSIVDPFGRQNFWTEAWRLIEHKWIFGGGLNAYQYAVQPYKSDWGYYPHNCYLQMWAEIGIFGLLSFLVMQIIILWGALKMFWRQQDSFRRNCLVGVSWGYTGFLFHSIFDSFFYSAALAILFWLLMALIRVLSAEH